MGFFEGSGACRTLCAMGIFVAREHDEARMNRPAQET